MGMRSCGVLPYEGKEDYIFVSCSRSDADTVYPLIEFMSRDGYRIWYAGEDRPDSIAKHLAESSGFLAFLSNNSTHSHNCNKEFNDAAIMKKPQVCVLLEETSLSPAKRLQLSAVRKILRYGYPDQDAFRRQLLGIRDIEGFQETWKKPGREDKTEIYLDTPEAEKHRVYLLVRKSTGEEIRITGEAFRIGRKNELCDYTIEGNPKISRVHAVLYPGQTECGIEDEHSLNRVYLNGEKLEPDRRYRLSDGDTVMLSREQFLFLIREES